ncbi:MAG: hypothetical protein K6A92_11500 [Lachnospiraceae bacterium]|nr:hypothetical protein [Lachnospiraceae bacterium]
MFGRIRPNRELEALLTKVHMNASNNYKDAAQEAYHTFVQLFKTLQEEGKLSDKQKQHYAQVQEELAFAMEGYTHKDQKPDINGLAGK